MSEAIKKYWQQLESREQIVLIGGGVMVVLILFYALVWQPWHKSITSMQTSIEGMRRDLIWVRQHVPIIKSGGQSLTKKTQDSKESLLSVVESTAKQSGINKSIQQMIPTNDNKVRVVFDEVDFNSWVRWIDTLLSKHSVNVEQVSADRDDDKPNIAEIRVTFVR